MAIALVAFGPALRGSFIFDDFNLPFSNPKAGEMPAGFWIGGVRPVLMVTYWVNFLMSGTNTVTYHLTNVGLHAATAVLVFFILKRLFSMDSAVRSPGAYGLAGAAIFLVHPLQTESVDYIAGRSEVVSGLLFCAAWLIFLRAFSSETRVATSIQILALGGAAVLAKENAICLPAVLIATDLYWADQPFSGWVRRRIKLYLPFVFGGLVGGAFILRSLTANTAAGFGSGATPAEYALTQCKVILTYVCLFFLPAGQNGDWQLPFFHSLADSGAWMYALAFVGFLAGVVWLSSRMRLVSFGLVIFLLMLAPTSSIVPIRDALAERRMYMPVIGLILASIAAVDRLRLSGGVLKAVAVSAVLLFTALSWKRSEVWSGPEAFWKDSVIKAPTSWRAHFGLGGMMISKGDCRSAIQELSLARSENSQNEEITWNLAEALQCGGQPERALNLFQSLTGSRRPAEAWNHIAYINAGMGKRDEVFDAVDKALSLDPANATAYAYRGLARLAAENIEGARADFERSLQLDPQNEAARTGIQRLPKPSDR